MNFPEHWIGHEQIIKMLSTALRQNRLGHGFIMDGPSGVGKKSMAFWVGVTLLCQGEQKPCRTCPACIKWLTDNHPDFLLVEPEEGSIKNHQVEEMQEFLSVKPFLGKTKVVVVDDADTMTVSAQNRLLKTLEEPPEGTYIFLVTTNYNRLLPTVLSRSQTLRFQALSLGGIASCLTNHYNVDRVHAEQIASLSGGSLARALEMANSETLGDSDRFVKALLDALNSKNQLKPFELADQYDDKLQWEQCLEWLMADIQQRIHQDIQTGSSALVYRLSNLGPVVEDAIKALREQANERIVIDMMLLKMQEVYYD